VLVRRGQRERGIPDVAAVDDVHRAIRPDGGRMWWTRERVLAGLLAFHHVTGLAPTTSRNWAGLILTTYQGQRRYPTAYAVLRHFPNFRAAWTAAGISLGDARWAPWTAADERYLVSHLGVQPTGAIAISLGRGEPAVRARARKFGLRVGTARGLPILRVARVAGVSEYVLRAYIRRGELAAFKGAKHLYVEPQNLLVVAEIDWHHPPAELEQAALPALRQRLLTLLISRAGGTAAASSARPLPSVRHR
jgi:hypothetical protein